MANIELLEVITLEKNQIKSILELNNVNNTADANKPVSTNIQAAINLKQDILDLATQQEMELGVETNLRIMSPERIKQAIAALVNWGGIGGDINNQTDLITLLDGKQDSIQAATQGEMEAGTEAGTRTMSPANVKQAIDALGGLPAVPGTPTNNLVLAYNHETEQFFWWDYTYSNVTPITVPNSQTFDIVWWWDFADDTTFYTDSGKIIEINSKGLRTDYIDQGNAYYRMFAVPTAYNGKSVGRALVASGSSMSGYIGSNTTLSSGTYIVAAARRADNAITTLGFISNKFHFYVNYSGAGTSNLHIGVDTTNSEFSLDIPDAPAIPEIEIFRASWDNSDVELDYDFGAVNASKGSSIETSFTINSDPFNLGYNFANLQNCDVDYGEVIWFSSKLTPERIEIIEGYLAHKWGIASKLPALHPYKNQAPEGGLPLFVPGYP